ncbi:MAG: ArdC-like ssDNA-binding domain-containing protein, partial [Ruthenibacterium sp.]
MDLKSLINSKNGTAAVAEQPRLSKEEYAAQKQAEREAVWARVDTQTEAVLGSGEALKDFLDFTAKCNPQRTANLLLLHAQNPEATQVKTFEGWQEAGRSVQRGAEGYTFLLGQKYE